MQVQIEIALTGDVRVGDVPVGGPARVVLAALVLERPAGVPRERLADVLWPDGPPRTWASALRTHVSRVRSALAAAVPGGGETVVAGEAGWQLSLPSGVELAVDVEGAAASLAAAREALGSGDASGALAAASAAIEGLRAPFLPGHPGDWADEVRAGLDETSVAAHEVVSLAALATGDPDRALAAADAAVARAPLRESTHRARWASLAAGGNRAEALRAYQRLRRGLADELGVDPSPETEAAYLDLLGRPGRPAPAPAAAAPAGPAGAAPFVGRERELAVLAEAWGQAAGGARHVVVVTGEAGIGKTRLTTEAARRIGHEGLVLFGRCDQEAIVPYQPVVEALDGLVAATPPDELPALGDEATSELAAVLPSLPGPRRVPGGDGRARLFASMTDLVAAAAKERPLLLVLDDLQWADDDTLLFMRHLLRRAGDAAVLVVAITRDHDLEPGHTLGEVVHSLERDGWVRRLPLAGLAEEEVRELAGRLGRDADPVRLVAETAGNPFLVTELLRGGADWPGAIPPGVHALVTSRVGRLDPAAADLLRAAAVAGARFELDLVAAAAGLEGRALLDAVEVALASGLVVEEDADRYRFPHDIVRRTLVAQLSAARRRALHHDLAGAIEALRAGELDAQAPVLAHHAAAGAGPRGDARAVHWSRVASAQATARSAPAEAVRLCRQALVLVPAGDDALRAAVTAELGEALVAAGDAAGPSTLVEGADLAARAGQPDILAAAALALADAADDRPDLRPDALRIVRAASATPDEDLVRHARLLARAIRLGDEAVPPGDAVEALHAHVAAVAPGAVDARRRLAADLAVLAEASGEPRLRALAAHDRAMAAATLGDEPAVEASLADLRRWAIGDDRFARAVLADRAAARATATGPPAAAAALLAEVAAAHDALAPGTGDAAASRHRAVLAHLSPAVGATAPAAGGEGLHDLAMAALGAAASGDRAAAARARAALAPYADLACGDGYRTFAGAAAFHLGRLAAAAGESAEAERHLLTALRLHTAWHARPWVAWTQAALAGVLEARGRPTDRDWIGGLRAEAEYVATTQDLGPLT